ncbi:MAG TPA: chemotaxis protein CheW [Anaerovoracaceae bacterium]|nr:chemotaxis protein CheW [Anaerovoracaceae bacterium]
MIKKADTLEGKYLIFAIEDELYGMEIRYITEIIGIQPIAEVPGLQKDYIKGITNLRGKIIPVMDVRLRFNKPERAYDKRTCIIVIDTNDSSMGLIVDRVAEVVPIPDDEIVPPPEMGKGKNKYIKGVGNAEGNVRLLLDCERLLTDGDE